MRCRPGGLIADVKGPHESYTPESRWHLCVGVMGEAHGGDLLGQLEVSGELTHTCVRV